MGYVVVFYDPACNFCCRHFVSCLWDVAKKEDETMNSTTNKEKWWIYLIFLFVGIISLFIGFFIGNGLLDGGLFAMLLTCLLYTSDAADDLLCVDLGGRRIIKKKK